MWALSVISKVGAGPKRVYLRGRPQEERAVRDLCTSGRVEQLMSERSAGLQRQVDLENNFNFMMAWLPLFAVNEPTELEVKRALVATHETTKLCPSGKCLQDWPF